MSQAPVKPKKPKIGQRLVRALFVGNMIGTLLFFISYFFATAINGISGTTTISPIPVSLGMYGFGLSASIGIELSKDLEA